MLRRVNLPHSIVKPTPTTPRDGRGLSATCSTSRVVNTLERPTNPLSHDVWPDLPGAGWRGQSSQSDGLLPGLFRFRHENIHKTKSVRANLDRRQNGDRLHGTVFALRCRAKRSWPDAQKVRGRPLSS